MCAAPRLILIALLLAACRPEEAVPETTAPPTVTEAELRSAIDRTPRPLPDLRPAALGVAGTLTGQVSPTYPVGQAVSLAAPGSGFRVPDAGRIAAPGRVEVRLPPAPDLAGSERLTPLDWVREWGSFEPCAVDTLQVDSGQAKVRLTRVEVMTWNPEVDTSPQGLGDALHGPSNLRLATSPIEAFVNVLPHAVTETREVSDRTGFLLHADGDVWLRGERRCVFPYVTRLEEADQYNLFVNLKLHRGWNVVRVRLDGGVPRGRLRVTELVVTGGAPDFTFQPKGQLR